MRKALALVEDPESTTGAIAEVIELDESLAVNVLAAANAAQRSLRIPARTPRQAILTVGRNELHGLLHDAATYRFLDAAPGTAAARGALRLHAVDVARYARGVAERTGVSPDLAYLAGLVHDLGKLILPMAFDAAAMEEIAATGAIGRDLARLERQRLGVDHAEAAGPPGGRVGPRRGRHAGRRAPPRRPDPLRLPDAARRVRAARRHDRPHGDRPHHERPADRPRAAQARRLAGADRRPARRAAPSRSRRPRR